MFLGKRGRTIRDAYFLKPNRTGVQILAVNQDIPRYINCESGGEQLRICGVIMSHPLLLHGSKCL